MGLFRPRRVIAGRYIHYTVCKKTNSIPLFPLNIKKKTKDATSINNGPGKRLISFIKSLDDVSCMYVTCNSQSGFVSYQRKRGETLNSFDIPVPEEEVKTWWSRLQVGNDEIVVAIAWAQDEEIR